VHHPVIRAPLELVLLAEPLSVVSAVTIDEARV
jgi:hypothetical protein